MAIDSPEDIRHAVRDYLYARQGTAQPAPTIRRRLNREGVRCDNDAVELACAFLVGLEQVDQSTNKLGSTKYYKISSKGILAHERNDES